jgi:FSR family fosmidomycin resistance protein-like MFS transporter
VERTPPWTLSPGALALIRGCVHAVVDLGSVSAVFRTSQLFANHPLLSPFVAVVGYDLIAFALQFPLGALVDRLRATRAAQLVGLLLIAGSLGCVPVSSLATLVMAGLGNALFHIGAGAEVLRTARGRAAWAGVFVAPGALGLGLGLWWGRAASQPLWPLVVLLGASLAATALVREGPASGLRLDVARPASNRLWLTALLALLISVLVRSYVGFGASYQCPRGALLALGLPLAAFAGKLLGGFLADRAGWLATSVAALLVSAPLIGLGGDSIPVVLAGLLIFQTTMPVTLTAVYLLMPNRPATAFGLPCLALIGGALPTFYPLGQQLYGTDTFLAMIVASAVAVYVGLSLLGMGWRRGQPLADWPRT